MRAYVEVFLQVIKYVLMMKVWVLKRSEMYFILFVRTTVRSTKRVCKKIQRLKAKKQVVVPGLTVCTLICIDSLRTKEQYGNVEGVREI